MRPATASGIPFFGLSGLPWNRMPNIALKRPADVVGPRSGRPELTRNFKEEFPHWNARHNAKPGITGRLRMGGFRSGTDLGERIKCVLWHLESWSLMLGFRIMPLTFIKRGNAA